MEAPDGSPMRMKSSGGGFVLGSSPTSVLSPTTSYTEGSGSGSSLPESPDGGLVMMMMERMNLRGGFGGSLPWTPRAKRAVGLGFEEENEGLDGIDVGWISELVK